MTDDLPAGIQSRRATLMGWAIFVTFVVLLWNIVNMPRTSLELRGPLIAFHYSMGMIVFVLALARIKWWFSEPTPKPPAGLPAASFAFNRAILFAVILVYGVEGFVGFAYAWGIGHHVAVFGIPVPTLMGQSEPARMSMGYFHSALGFYYLMLFSIWLAFGYYQHLRYKVGLRRLFPGARV